MTRTRMALITLGVILAALAVFVALRGAVSSGAEAGPIPQPPLRGSLRVAPDRDRVDLRMPAFSKPTEVTNPLHPTATLASELLLGRVDGKTLRVEITLLPTRKLVEWNGARVEALVAQYVAFLGGEIHEVALDFYAQADDGAVWYLGEDVFNFENGLVADTEGTWLAGLHGPGAMIMPAEPRVGDVYRPENMPGYVFEEVTVKRTGLTTSGPRGPIAGALVVDELHLDGGREQKIFAPGYGEFHTGVEEDFEALALAVPIDAVGGSAPAALGVLADGAATIVTRARAANWAAAQAEFERVSQAWRALRADAPPLLRSTTDETLGVLLRAIGRRDETGTAGAALDIAQANLDLQLRHNPVTDVDLARLDLRAARLVLDAEAGHTGAVAGGFAALEWTRDRFAHVLAQRDLFELEERLDTIRAAVNADDMEAAAAAAARLRRSVATFSNSTSLIRDLDLGGRKA